MSSGLCDHSPCCRAVACILRQPSAASLSALACLTQSWNLQPGCRPCKERYSGQSATWTSSHGRIPWLHLALLGQLPEQLHQLPEQRHQQRLLSLTGSLIGVHQLCRCPLRRMMCSQPHLVICCQHSQLSPLSPQHSQLFLLRHQLLPLRCLHGCSHQKERHQLL